MREALKVLAALLVGIAIVVGLFFLGFAIKEYSVNRNAEINRNSFERQTTLRDEITDQYDDITRVDVQIVQAGDNQDLARALGAQRIAMVDQLCSLADQLSRSQSIEPGIDRIIREECS